MKCPKCKEEEIKEWDHYIKKHGHCLWCQLRKEREDERKFDSAEAIKNGEGSSSEDAICPHCGKYQSDSIEFSDGETEVQCDHCDKEFGLRKEYSVEYKTWRLDKA